MAHLITNHWQKWQRQPSCSMETSCVACQFYCQVFVPRWPRSRVALHLRLANIFRERSAVPSKLPRHHRGGFLADWAASPFIVAPFCKGSGLGNVQMQLSRARLLSSDRMMCQGADFVSVAFSMSSRAREYSYQRVCDGRSIGLSFHWRSGSLIRASNRRCCSSLPTSSQYLMRRMPPRQCISQPSGQGSRKRRYCSFVQKPITCSTPARLYQLRSKITISPAAGKCCMYRWMYIWLFAV